MKATIKMEKLAELMFRRGWSRRQLAKNAGIGEVTAQQICNGQRNPSPPVVKKLTDAFGVDFSELFDLEQEDRADQGA
ncbi:helix-turn-helix transcriptional regulator [Paenibacillus wynnii]|uniref:HTH cro/C1-type domain-containing protein n=1 Tax=Paenibacillus wynnii TaxID=268407 RepID=A0A098M2M3_9BACL|nr:helix-turn-helix transcriptional regulator [Paenibacillus wynnii]KGE16635.1 hypothetical protein PWYN_18160 [Paenibacillus wynnii]